MSGKWFLNDSAINKQKNETLHCRFESICPCCAGALPQVFQHQHLCPIGAKELVKFFHDEHLLVPFAAVHTTLHKNWKKHILQQQTPGSVSSQKSNQPPQQAICISGMQWTQCQYIYILPVLRIDGAIAIWVSHCNLCFVLGFSNKTLWPNLRINMTHRSVHSQSNQLNASISTSFQFWELMEQ